MFAAACHSADGMNHDAPGSVDTLEVSRPRAPAAPHTTETCAKVMREAELTGGTNGHVDGSWTQLKRAIAQFWDRWPCGAHELVSSETTARGYFEAIARLRYGRGDHVIDLFDLRAWEVKRVLEVGCGIGTDLCQFALSAAQVAGIDVSPESTKLARRALDARGLAGWVMVADGENLPFADRSFDLVYTWGVVHHCVSPAQVVAEIFRVLKPGGELITMVYNRHSVLALQVWIRYGLLRGRPFASIRSLMARHLESPGTRAYTRAEAAELFSTFDRVSIESVVTRYDIRLGRRVFLPRWLRRAVPRKYGWFIVLRGTRRERA